MARKLLGLRAACRARGADHGGDSGLGRTAAIAYVREGADAVINCLRDEDQVQLAAADASYATGQIYGEP
jgi:hypothetical protein